MLNPPRKNKLELIATILAALPLCCMVLLALLAVAPRLLGLTPLVVVSASMSPALEMGDMAFMRRTDAELLSPGNVIAYDTPTGLSTHRIVGIEGSETGLTFRTKGDRNLTSDPLPVGTDSVVGRLVMRVPVLGSVAVFVRSLPGIILLIVVPLVVYAAMFALDRAGAKRPAFMREAQHHPAGRRYRVSLVVTGAVALIVAGALVRTVAIMTDTQSVAANTVATATCFPRTFYLHNNPTPPVVDTNSQTNLPLDQTAPIATTLYNYDQDRDAFAGLLIAKGGSGASESDPTKYQAWRTAVLAEDQCLRGDITFSVWAAIKDWGADKAGQVNVFLRDYNGSTYTEIGNGSVTDANWQNGTSTWVAKTVTINGLNYTVAAGNRIDVKITVDASSEHDMWFAYDTTSYPSALNIPKFD